LPAQQSVQATLATIADAVDTAELLPPAVIVVGDVVAMREQLGWREHRALQGVRVLLPRSSTRSSRVALALRHAGAAVIEVPIAREVGGDPAALARLAVEVREGRVGTLIVTDVDAVRRLTAAMMQVGADVRAFAGTRLWSMDSRTSQALRSELGLDPDEDLSTVEELRRIAPSARGPVVILGREEVGHDLPASLGGRTVVSARTVPITGIELPEVDVVVVPASRLVAPMVRALGGRDDPMVAMGPKAAAALRALDRRVDAEASEPTGSSVVAAVVTALAAHEVGTGSRSTAGHRDD
jgi:uroporphyrinogen III methyltransferase/synthase